jgi:hypothetical protein
MTQAGRRCKRRPTLYCVRWPTNTNTPSSREVEIDIVLNVPDSETKDTIMDKFLEWIADNGWKAGGAVKDLSNESVS